MQSKLIEKVNRLNELNTKKEMGQELMTSELNEQKILREELLNYIKFAITKEK